MPDLKQALKDFVATANSGKYPDEATLISKFPELKGYDINALKDFVATANSGRYTNEDELFSKFPEFGISGQQDVSKKKAGTELPSEDTSLDSSKPLPDYLKLGQDAAERGFNRAYFGGSVPGSEFRGIPVGETTQPTGPLPKYLKQGQAAAETGFATPTGVTPLPETITNVIPEMAPPKKKKLLKNLGAFEESMDRNAYLDNIGTRALSGLTSLEKMVASLPETVVNIASIPQNVLAWATGWDIAANADTFKKQFGISNPVLNKLNEEEKKLREVTAKFNKERYESSGIVDNIQKGNYSDAFELLGSSIVESAPVSIAMMMGGATLAPAELAAISTAGFLEQNREQLGEENPDMPEIEKTVKALGMSAAETVFSAIGTGTIGQVYKDIVKKEGLEAGKNIFKDGLVQAYKGALRKYGAPIGLLGEGIEEAATQITQNVLSNKPTFEGVADAFVTGAGSGVVFTAPINAMKARDKVTNLVETYKSKEEINAVLKDTDTKLDQVFNVSKDAPITAEQIQIANTNKSRDILSKNLAKKVKDGEISEDEAKQSMYVFDKVQQVSNAVKDLKVTNTEKAQIATLLRQRDQLKTDIQNKDDVLVGREKQEIADINNQIQQIIMDSKPQVEAVVIETPEVTAQRTARIAELEALTAPGSQLSVTSPEWMTAVEELQKLKKEQDAIQKQTTDEGVLRTEQPEVGLQQVVEGDQGPQVVTTGTQEVISDEKSQEITGQLIDLVDNYNTAVSTTEGTPNERRVATRKSNKAFKKLADFFGFQFGDRTDVNQSAKQDALSTLSTMLNQSSPEVQFADVNELINTYKEDKTKGVESPVVKSVDILFGIKPTVSLKTQPTTQIQENGQPTTKPTGGPIAGNRLFNKPIKAVSEIANRYYQRIFGTERPRYFGSRGLDEARGKRLAQAFIDMKHNPNDPEVKASYEALAKETLEQYQAFLDAGYTIEINNEEPYASSQDMIEDLRNNKRIKIFSTESGFGSKKITKKQRQDNPLLAKTDFKDVNGKPLLVNDVFRAIHDFFGHAELGNSFGPKGEENAWNVHVRMFSPLARRAMTTETRGQNSFVNFSGVNDKIEKDRDEARKLREAGDIEGAKKLVDKIYEEGSFAEQKIGLLPEEFSQFDEQDMGDVSMRPEGLQERDTEVEPAVVAEPTLVIEEEQFVPMTSSEVKTDAFTKDNAIDYIEDEKETESGRIVTYISSLTVEARNADGDPIGTITKLTDEDKMFSFIAEDIDGNEIGFDGFETLGEAKQAIADSYNKIKKKEFTKEQKKKAKEKAKVEAKKAKTKAKGEFETKALKLAEDIDNFELPSWFTPTLPEGTQKAGLSADEFKRLIAKSVVEIGRLMDRGVEFSVALKEAVKEIVNILGEAKRNNIEKTVTDFFNEREKVSEDKLPGYAELMSKVDELIARQKRKGIADAKIVSNLDTLIRNSEVYSRATDAQKKVMEREGRFKMGVGAKRAVSIGRVLGALKDITNITREEKMLVIKQIRDLSRDAAKELAKDIREMASKGKITSIQAANIVSRFSKVNMLNEISVSNFVDYMAKVFANAEYADKIDVAKSKLKMAKKNIVTKIGIADGLVGSLNRLFSMNPTLIPNEFLGRYLELVDMFGARQAVLTLDEKSTVTKDAEAILNEIDNEQSKADELADRFNASENKVFKDDELDYAASVKKMLDEKEIDEKEAETMRKYKEDIAPQVEETELTEDEAEAERKELTDAVKKSIVDGSELPTKDERDLAKELRRLISTDAVDGLTNTELKNLLKVINNINNNYLPHYTQLMVEKMNAINNGKVLTSAVKKSKVAKLSGLYARAKSLITKKGAIVELIRRSPLFNIDQLFGDFKTKDIFNSILNKAAEAEAKFSAELKKVQNILEKAEEKVAKSFKLDPNKTLMSKFKMMTYMIQLEFESNKGNKQVNPAANYLKATIKHIDAGKSQFAEREAEMLQDILNQYSDADGNIDNEKLYNSFNQAEKDAIKDIRSVNESLREKAEYTAAIIRGDRINPLNNYVHLNVLHEHQPNDLTTGSAFVTEYNDSMRPSTKAKSLIARTGKVSPLNFDVFASAQRGAKFVLMDYNLTEPIRTARKTINQTVANLEQEGRIPKEKRDIINAINSAFEEAIENLLTNTYVSTSIADDVIDYINKQGYRAILAGTGRFISELSSNIGFALISDPKAFTEGIKYKGVIMSTDAPLIMENVNSKQTNRIFPTDTLSGKLIDTSILNQASGIKSGKAKNAVANKIQQIWNLSGKKYTNLIELQADALISTPDKAIMRPMWFGSFANQFKNITGKEVDFEKIAANDEAYMEDNKEAIDKAKTLADERSVMTGATDNAFMGILKGTTKPNQSATLRAFNNFNNFMTRFLIFEFVTARTAINAAMGNGSLDKKQGVALLGAVTTRMVVYTLLTQMMGTGLMGLFFDDEEEETEKSFMQKLGQAFTSALTSLTLGRDFGNATKMMVNYGLERVNENYLDFLREGDYDPYKDAIQYSIVPPEKKGQQRDLSDFLLNMGGAFGPALKTADFITRKALESEKTKEDAIERREKEINVRIPLEVLGNAGFVPLYKDIRKAVMKDLYKDLEKAEKTKGDKKRVEEEKLQGFQNQEDMKRYDYDLWYRTFGPDAPDFDAKQAEKLLRREKDSVERAMKDEMYDYAPKSKKGFGSSGFGENKGKSKGGFGTSKFGQ